MSFKFVFPLYDTSENFTFDECNSNEEFIVEIVRIFFSDSDLRVKEAALAVFMAYRDHYPKYLANLKLEQINLLNSAIESAEPKIIKLRRIALSALSKVA